MGIDYGSRKVGIAFSDEMGTMGFPFEVVPNDSRLSDALALLVETQKIGTVVIGESRDFKGNKNPIANPARALGEEIASRTGVPVAYESEVYTTQEARRDPEGVYTNKKGDVDASASALILTSYLSRHAPR